MKKNNFDIHHWRAKYLIEQEEPFQYNPEDALKIDIPLFIRLLEYSREDLKEDIDIHIIAKNAIELCRDPEKVLTMDDYTAIIRNTPTVPNKNKE